MKRLTYKIIHNGQVHYDVEEKYVENPNPFSIYVNSCQAMTKLGQLEDIEEEIGIDLITLFKALKQGGVYVKYGNKVDLKTPMSGFQICGSETNGITLWSQFKLEPKDYGKTWALTKEELL